MHNDEVTFSEPITEQYDANSCSDDESTFSSLNDCNCGFCTTFSANGGREMSYASRVDVGDGTQIKLVLKRLTTMPQDSDAVSTTESLKTTSEDQTPSLNNKRHADKSPKLPIKKSRWYEEPSNLQSEKLSSPEPLIYPDENLEHHPTSDEAQKNQEDGKCSQLDVSNGKHNRDSHHSPDPKKLKILNDEGSTRKSKTEKSKHLGAAKINHSRDKESAVTINSHHSTHKKSEKTFDKKCDPELKNKRTKRSLKNSLTDSAKYNTVGSKESNVSGLSSLSSGSRSVEHGAKTCSDSHHDESSKSEDIRHKSKAVKESSKDHRTNSSEKEKSELREGKNVAPEMPQKSPETCNETGVTEESQQSRRDITEKEYAKDTDQHEKRTTTKSERLQDREVKSSKSTQKIPEISRGKTKPHYIEADIFCSELNKTAEKSSHSKSKKPKEKFKDFANHHEKSSTEKSSKTKRQEPEAKKSGDTGSVSVSGTKVRKDLQTARGSEDKHPKKPLDKTKSTVLKEHTKHRIDKSERLQIQEREAMQRNAPKATGKAEMVQSILQRGGRVKLPLSSKLKKMFDCSVVVPRIDFEKYKHTLVPCRQKSSIQNHFKGSKENMIKKFYSKLASAPKNLKINHSKQDDQKTKKSAQKPSKNISEMDVLKDKWNTILSKPGNMLFKSDAEARSKLGTAKNDEESEIREKLLAEADRAKEKAQEIAGGPAPQTSWDQAPFLMVASKKNKGLIHAASTDPLDIRLAYQEQQILQQYRYAKSNHLVKFLPSGEEEPFPPPFYPGALRDLRWHMNWHTEDVFSEIAPEEFELPTPEPSETVQEMLREREAAARAKREEEATGAHLADESYATAQSGSEELSRTRGVSADRYEDLDAPRGVADTSKASNSEARSRDKHRKDSTGSRDAERVPSPDSRARGPHGSASSTAQGSDNTWVYMEDICTQPEVRNPRFPPDLPPNPGHVQEGFQNHTLQSSDLMYSGPPDGPACDRRFGQAPFMFASCPEPCPAVWQANPGGAPLNPGVHLDMRVDSSVRGLGPPQFSEPHIPESCFPETCFPRPEPYPGMARNPSPPPWQGNLDGNLQGRVPEN